MSENMKPVPIRSQPAYWLVAWARAIEERNLVLVKEARQELRQMGIDVRLRKKKTA